MSVAIVQGWDPSVNRLARLTVPNKKEYCDRHGYSLITNISEYGYWSKLHTAAHALRLNYDWIMVLDIDTLIMDITFPLKGIFYLAENNTDLMFAGDIHGINMGVSFWRCTEWSRSFMGKVLEQSSRYPHEQTPVAQLLLMEPKPKWYCANQRTFNSYLYEFYAKEIPNGYPEGQYQEGDFLLHVPGLPIDKKMEVLNGYLALAKKE